MHTPPNGVPAPQPPRRSRLHLLLTMSRWQARASEEIADLREELEANRRLAALYQLMAGAADYDPPPHALSRALREGRAHVEVTIDGQAAVIGLEPVIRRGDLLIEHQAWRVHVDAHRRVAAKWIVPDAVGMHVTELPDGHHYQAWRVPGGSRIVIVNRHLHEGSAPVAMRAALAALRLRAAVLPLLCWLACV